MKHSLTRLTAFVSAVLFFGFVTVSSAAVLPDLSIYSVSCSPTAPKIGEKMTCTVVVRNGGQAAANGTIQVKGPSGNAYGSPIYAGGMQSITFTQPVVLNTLGTNTLSFAVDSINAVTESNEYNNTFSKTVTVSQGVPGSITLVTPNGGENIKQGQTFDLKIKMPNDKIYWVSYILM